MRISSLRRLPDDPIGRRPPTRWLAGDRSKGGPPARQVALIVAALALALGACQPAGRTVLNGHITSVPLPPLGRLAVRVCEQPETDCNLWLYPDAQGRFEVADLKPAGYTVTVSVEQPNGLTELVAVQAMVAVGQTTTVDIAVLAMPSIPST
jgi:hypothetical protein